MFEFFFFVSLGGKKSLEYCSTIKFYKYRSYLIIKVTSCHLVVFVYESNVEVITIGVKLYMIKLLLFEKLAL